MIQPNDTKPPEYKSGRFNKPQNRCFPEAYTELQDRIRTYADKPTKENRKWATIRCVAQSFGVNEQTLFRYVEATAVKEEL